MEILLVGSIVALCTVGYGFLNAETVARRLWGQHLKLEAFIAEVSEHQCSPIIISIDRRHLTAISAFAPIPTLLVNDAYYFVVLETTLATGRRIYFEELAAVWHPSTLDAPYQARTALDCQDEAVRRVEELGRLITEGTQHEIQFSIK
jgi:hypothetical protein